MNHAAIDLGGKESQICIRQPDGTIEYTSELMARRISEAVARPGVEVIVRAPRRAGNLRWI
jgi:hypothetical protein